MDEKSKIEITTRDRLLRAWENSMELVRDFQNYSKADEDHKQVSKVFAEFAEEEGLHASKFRELLNQYENN